MTQLKQDLIEEAREDYLFDFRKASRRFLTAKTVEEKLFYQIMRKLLQESLNSLEGKRPVENSKKVVDSA